MRLPHVAVAIIMKAISSSAMLTVCLITGVVWAVYFDVSKVPFQYDDIHSVVDNIHIRSLDNIPKYFVDPTLFSEDSRNAMYRPMVVTSYALTHWIADYDAEMYHYGNVVIHIANAIFVAVLVQIFTRRSTLSAITALIFAVHPVNSESVIYVSGRSESLCALFILVSIWSYFKSEDRSRSGINSESLWLYLLSVGAYTAALGTKEIAVTFPVVLLFLSMHLRNSGFFSFRKKFLSRHLPFWFLAVVYVVVNRNLIESAVIFSVRSLDVQLLTQIKAIVYYVILLTFPAHLSVEHQFSLSNSALDITVFFSFVACSSAIFILWQIRRFARGVFWWWGGCMIALVPTLVVPLNVLVNEHRLYIPSIAISIASAAAFSQMMRRRNVVGCVMLFCFMVVSSAFCIQRTRVWSSSEELWRDAVAKGPYMPRPHIYVGDALMSAGNQEQALVAYDMALRVHPEVLSAGDMLSVFNNTGAAYLKMGKFSDAIEWYTRALEVDSTYKKSKEALGGLLALQEMEGEKKALALKKTGLLSLVRGDVDESIRYLKAALDLHFMPDAFFALGMAYERLGDVKQALRIYNALPRLMPQSPYVKAARSNVKRLNIVGDR